MKYLSIDIEATGLDEKDLMIEFAMIPFDAHARRMEESLGRQYLIKCPSFRELKPRLHPWVIKHNEKLIDQAHREGISLLNLQEELEHYLTSVQVQDYFDLPEKEKITLFGKSMNSIDLPFLRRDLGQSFMEQHFNHRTLDLSSVAYAFIDLGLLPAKMSSGSELMKELGLGDVQHTAFDDAKNTALMYLMLLEKFGHTSGH